MIFLPYPVANNRYYRHFRGMTILSKEGAAYKKEAAWKCKAAGMKILYGDVELYVILHPRMNKNGSCSKVRLDLDGCLKVACDSLNGIGYEDDKQITRIVAEVGEQMIDGGLSIQVRNLEKM